MKAQVMEAKKMKRTKWNSDSQTKMRRTKPPKGVKKRAAVINRQEIDKATAFKEIAEINWNKFISLPKDLIKQIQANGSSLAALAVYFVLCSRADFRKDKWFSMQQEEIGRLCGLSRETVSKAIKQLEEKEIVKSKKVSNGNRVFYAYKVKFERRNSNERGNANISFYTGIIESGIWASLSPRAKALYIGMRLISSIDIVMAYQTNSNENNGYQWNEPDDWRSHNLSFALIAENPQWIVNRQCDYCSDSLAKICSTMKISTANIGTTALLELTQNGLVVKIQSGYRFEVYLKPKGVNDDIIFKPSNNEQPAI